MTSPLTFREAKPEDVPAITELHKEGWRVGYADLFTPEILEKGIEKHCTRWPRVFASPDFFETTFVLAELQDEVVGFAHFGPGAHEAGRFEDNTQDRIELYSFYVHPTHWGSAVATELIRHVLMTLARRGHKAVHLMTYAGVTRARRFYEKVGFKETGRTSVYELFGVPVPEVEYVRPTE